MKEIPLSCTRNCKHKGKYVALVDDEDYELLNKFSWHANKKKNTIYASRNAYINNKKVCFYMQWDIISRAYIDHIDLNGLNNQKSNLRVCTHQQNSMNMAPRKNSFSKYKGVSWSKWANKWRSKIGFNKKTIHIGYFKSELEAAKAYDDKAIELFKEFANINFPYK